MKKRIFSIILAVAMIMSCTVALAAESDWQYVNKYTDSDWANIASKVVVDDAGNVTATDVKSDGYTYVGFGNSANYFTISQEAKEKNVSFVSKNTTDTFNKLTNKVKLTKPFVKDGNKFFASMEFKVDAVKVSSGLGLANNNIRSFFTVSNGAHGYATKLQAGYSVVNNGQSFMSCFSSNDAAAAGNKLKVNDKAYEPWTDFGDWVKVDMEFDNTTHAYTLTFSNSKETQVLTYQTDNKSYNGIPNLDIEINIDAADLTFKNADEYTITAGDCDTYFTKSEVIPEGTDTYLKLATKNTTATANDISSNPFQIKAYRGQTGGGYKFNTAGIWEYSVIFKVVPKVKANVDRVIRTRSVGDYYNYGLRVDSHQTSLRAGFINNDSTSFYSGKFTSGVDYNAWLEYKVKLDYTTKKATASIINTASGSAIQTSTWDITGNNNDTNLIFKVMSDAADVYIDEITETRRIYIEDESTKAITVDDSANTVTASVNIACDIPSEMYKSGWGDGAYGVAVPKLIISTFDSSNRLIDTDSVDPVITREASANIGGDGYYTTCTVSIPKTEDYAYAKAFLWKGFEDITPFSTSWTNKAK